MKVRIETDRDFKDRIFMNIVNSFLAGALVFAGSMANGGLTKEGCMLSLGASAVVFLTKFKDYWNKEMIRGKGGKINLLFNFI